MKPSTRNVVVAGIVGVTLVGIYFARHVLVPFLLAAVVAYTLNPLVTMLERKGLRRTWATLLVMVVILLVIAGAVAAVVPVLFDQLRQFADRLPGYAQSIQEGLEPVRTWLQEKYPDQLQVIETEAANAARGILPALFSWTLVALQSALSSLASMMAWLLTVVVVPVFSYYLLVDHVEIRATVKSLVPKHLRPAIRMRVLEIDQVLRAWLKGQLTVACVLAVIYAVGLTLMDIPLGLLFGLVGGLSHIVPYMGLVTGFLPAAMLAFLDTGMWTSPLKVASVFLLGLVLETTVISPRIVGGGLGLPPAVVLLAVLVGGELFGFTGLLLALPVTASGLVLLRDLRRTFDAPAAAPLAETRRHTRRRRPRP